MRDFLCMVMRGFHWYTICMPARKKNQKHLLQFLAPHKKDKRPAFFTRKSLGTLIVGLMVIQGFYLIQSSNANRDGTILASVITDLTNETRMEHNVRPLAVDPLLMLAAQAKAEDMAEREYFSHVDPNGIKPWAWFNVVDYTYRYAGENLAVNFVDSRDIENAWVASPSHYANLIKPQYTRIGIGLAEGKYKGNTTTYVVQFFATPPLGQRYSVYAHAEKALNLQKIAQGQPIKPYVAQTTPTPEEVAKLQNGDPSVLGASTKTSWISRKIHEAQSSPRVLNRMILLSILTLVLLAFILASVFHAKMRYKEMLFDVLIIVAIITGLIWFNGRGGMPAEVPLDAQESSIEIEI